MKKKISTYLALLLFSISALSAQIVINEYSASNLENFTDSFGRTEDWIELYNTSNEAVDISGWHISDKLSKPEKWSIPSGTIIPANGHLVFLCSGRDGVFNGEYHTNFKLAQTTGSDIVLISNSDGILLEMHELNLTLVEHSNCRITDGSPDWAISIAPSFGTSNDESPQRSGYTAAPSMSLEGGFHEGTQTITITNNEPNSVLRYTLNGTNPRNNSPIYTNPIVVNETTVIKAQAFSNEQAILPGKMDFNTYFIDEDFSLAVFSVAADQVINLANGQGELIPIGSLEYFNLDKEREATSFGSLNRHGQDSWALPHRSLDWISRDEMGYSKAVDAQLFKYSERDEYQKFMFRNSGDDNYPAINDFAHQGSAHVRDEYVHTLAMNGEMKLDQRAVERVILFLNGQYWGVYGMRERPVDHDYTDEYYDQGKYEIQYLSTWDRTEAEYGGLQAVADWENLRNFIENNDMSVAENYQVAEDSINMLSLIDYMLMNLNVVAVDWLNYNTGWWRGLNPEGDHKKWGYILWDLDATFDYYINYTGVPNQSPNAEPCDMEEISLSMDQFFGTEITNHGGGGTFEDCTTVTNGTSPYPVSDPVFQQVIDFYPSCCDITWNSVCQQSYDFISGFIDEESYDGNVGRHEKIFLKLIAESDEFRQLYYGRYADLMNTVFTCENMITTLDSMIAVIEPEMPRQTQRWGGTLTEWEDNVNDLRDFINERCTLLDDGALNCYEELSGPYELVLRTEPDGIGEIDLNTLDIESFPWSGEYFGGMENKIKAKVFDEYEDDYVFSHWVSSNGNVITPNVEERRAAIILEQADTLTAVFEPGVTATVNLANKYNFQVFPNPASDYLQIIYNLPESAPVSVSLQSMLGQQLVRFPQAGGLRSAGTHNFRLALDQSLPSGLYLLEVSVGKDRQSYKINVVR